MDRLLAAFSYLFGSVSGICVYLMNKDGFARFHAMQSCLLSVILVGSGLGLAGLAVVGKEAANIDIGVVSALAFLAVFLVVGLLSIYLIFQAISGVRTSLPFIGREAERLSNL